MKEASKIPAIIWTFFIVFVFLSAFLTQAQEKPSVVGTWEYELEDQEGLAIYSDTHFMWLLSDKDRKSFQGDEPTESEKAAAFSSAVAGGGTYKHVGPSRITVHRMFSTMPNLVGREFTFEYEIEGDVIKYWVIQPDGTKGPMGKARRVKD